MNPTLNGLHQNFPVLSSESLDSLGGYGPPSPHQWILKSLVIYKGVVGLNNVGEWCLKLVGVYLEPVLKTGTPLIFFKIFYRKGGPDPLDPPLGYVPDYINWWFTYSRTSLIQPSDIRLFPISDLVSDHLCNMILMHSRQKAGGWRAH